MERKDFINYDPVSKTIQKRFNTNRIYFEKY